MKIKQYRLTRLEADLIVYALVNMNHLHDNDEFKSSFISAHKDTVKDLIEDFILLTK